LNPPLFRVELKPHEAAIPLLQPQMKGHPMSSNKPTFIAYSVRERGQGRNGKPFWVRIGGAWAIASGSPGFTIQLDALPLDGRIVKSRISGARIP
jgi:hypothetical protein